MTTEEWLDQPIDSLTREELTSRKLRLDKLMDDTTSPKWYLVVCGKWREVRTAIATKYPAAEAGEERARNRGRGDNMKETCDQCGAGFERLEARHVCDGLFYLFSGGKLTGVRDQVHDQETTYCAACYYECYAAGGDER